MDQQLICRMVKCFQHLSVCIAGLERYKCIKERLIQGTSAQKKKSNFSVLVCVGSQSVSV